MPPSKAAVRRFLGLRPAPAHIAVLATLFMLAALGPAAYSPTWRAPQPLRPAAAAPLPVRDQPLSREPAETPQSNRVASVGPPSSETEASATPTPATATSSLHPAVATGASSEAQAAVVPRPKPSSPVAPSPNTEVIAFVPHATNGLVTNEFAYWSPRNPSRHDSPAWEMDSGSLFAQDGIGWTGLPDAVAPNASSTNGNDSAVFRLNTKRRDFTDVSVSFDLLNHGYVTTSRTPAVGWDGVHIWLRYQSQFSLYVASVNRRDGTIAIKKKVPGGPSNGGTYYTLATGTHPVRLDAWQHVGASIRTEQNGAVTIQLFADGRQILSASDDGRIGGPPILAAGAVGIRGDNCNFHFKNFSVTDL